jgi:MoaA/NifB/PqqE/SkfB family radical SAM enzyme
MALRHLLNLTGDRLAALPILIVYLTDGCNSRCATCDIWRSPRRNMAPPLLDALVADAAALGVRWAILSGGEAMQHPAWAETAARFRAIGARVFLLTNGLLVERQAEAVAAHVDELVVSLDGGTPETYAAIRGVDGFARVLAGIAAAHRAGVRVTTRTTVQRANIGELSRIATAALSAGADAVSYLTVDTSSPFAFGARALDHALAPEAPRAADIAVLDAEIAAMEHTHADAFTARRIAESPARLRRMSAYFTAALDAHAGRPAAFPPVRCNAPQTSAVVEVDGRVRPCYFLPSAAALTPDAPHLRDAVNAPGLRELRAAVRDGQRPECTRCVCSLYKGPRALLTM